MTGVYSLSPHIVDGRQRDLIAAAHVRSPRPRRLRCLALRARHRFARGVLRGVRLLRRTPRRAAA
jgi:hypothetical protein